MSHELPPVEPAPAFVGKPWALRLGALLVAAFVLSALLAIIDRDARLNLEASKDRGPVAEKR